MLLTIVIPTHNRADSLKECLEALTSSIAGDSDCEVIVVDDHSGAAIASVIQALCKVLHVGYCRLEKNRGAAVARNTGIEKAQGVWVALLDDDVRVEKDWYDQCRRAVSHCPPATVGIEGMVVAAGKGVWDREVENLRGRAYLTCHIVYRRDMLRRIGGFDGRFISRYPACEDHELAMRALMWGDIVFNPLLRARHLPRAIHGTAYVKDSFHRMKSLLDAELYFFRKHRDRYHVVRHARTFWGTYKSIVLLHCLVSLKRRSAARLAAHPLQTITLIAASLIEQVTALLLLPKYAIEFFLCEFLHKPSEAPPSPSSDRVPCLRAALRTELGMPEEGEGGASEGLCEEDHGQCGLSSSAMCPTFFRGHIDEKRTRDCWRLGSATDISLLRCKPILFRSLLFPLLRRPVYSMTPVLQRIRGQTSLPDMRLFLRIDDVFMNEPHSVELLCDKLAQRRIPFCAAVTGNDLGSDGSSRLVERIRKSGGEIALHGFTHAGAFGPYASEILQMNFPCLDVALERVFEKAPAREVPAIFIPPFNAVNRGQIAYLTRHFKVICGGPETARFTDCYTGPLALRNGAWYVPSFFPFYGAAASAGSRMLRLLRGSRGFGCITVHLPVEARDGFAALMRLLESLAAAVTPWNYFFDNSNSRNTTPGDASKGRPRGPENPGQELV
jgi:glycosyltransferase involved in cell wall biosynthesis